MRASVIIVTWNSADVLGPCLDSVLAQEVRGGFETIVVDNASTDRTAELLREYGDRVRVIHSDENLLYGGGNNLAAQHARGEVLVLVNPDTELLAPDVVERLADAAAAPGVGIAGPKLVNPDGSLQPSCAPYPGVLRAAMVAAGLHRVLPDGMLARAAPQFWSHDRPLDTDWLMGAAIAVPSAVFREVGGFWDLLYSEEADLAYRVRQRGLRVHFEPSATVMHVGNHSASQALTDPQRAERVARAELAFLDAHYGRARALAIRTIVALGYAGRAAVLSLLGRRGRAAIYRAMTGVYART